MKLLIVEPHPDDAFLSLGWHLEKLWRDCDRLILTVYADEKRMVEAESYASAIGASSDTLGLTESPMLDSSNRPISIPELRDWLRKFQSGFDRVLFPLGLQHPDHLRVAATRVPGAYRYVEVPYGSKQKLTAEVNSKLEGMEIASISFPSKLKWRHSSIFKSQSRFFYYNSALLTSHYPEIVVCQSQN